ncbi:hypothetical protein [Nocardioides maradonensis]
MSADGTKGTADANQPEADLPDDDIERGILVAAGVYAAPAADLVAALMASRYAGYFNPSVVLQASVWVENDGTLRPLEDLTAEERFAVITYLVGTAPVMVEASRLSIAASVAIGVEPSDAAELSQALHELKEGWIERTPLLRRLRALDAFAGDEATRRDATVEAAPAAPAVEAVAEVRDADRGLWRVTTETSIYYLDLDRREAMRLDGAARGHHVAEDGVVVWANRLPNDRQWNPLVVLEECRIGAPMRLSAAVEGTLTPFRSTSVTRIESVDARDR